MNQELLQSWLALQCKAMPGALSACARVYSDGSPGGTMDVSWPQNREADPELNKLLEMAERSEGAITSTPRPGTAEEIPLLRIAHPIESKGSTKGVIAITLEQIPEAQHRSVLRLIEWGNTWLDLLQHQQGDGNSKEALLSGAIQCILRAESLQHAAMALTTFLAHRCGYERVAIGVKKQQGFRMLALSDSAQLPARSELSKLLNETMREAEVAGGTLHWPGDEKAVAHQALALAEQDGSVTTLLLPNENGLFAALTLESQHAPTQVHSRVEQFERLAEQIGPLLALKQASDRNLLARPLRTAGKPARTTTVKRLALICALLLAVVYLAGSDRYHIGGPAELEGALHRALTAPFDGYIATAHARAGERVNAGDLLAEMEDRELRLEQRQLQSEKSELEKEYRQSLARLEHAQARIFEAQIAQADARIDLLLQQLERVRIRAPFDGLVVSGDLSRSLGKPVERGEVLLEVAPLADYRVAIEIPGRDISNINLGDRGTLLLAARPATPLPVEVANTTRMPGGAAGAGLFRVEARLIGDSSRLRPGLRGVAKIDVGERNRFWIYTHEIADWLRYRLWAWLP